MNNSSKAIYVWQYLNEYESEKEKVLAAINKVLESGQLILGKSVVSFEKEFASYFEILSPIKSWRSVARFESQKQAKEMKESVKKFKFVEF